MQVEFDLGKGCISFQHPGLPGKRILAGNAWARYRNEAGSLRQADLAGTGCLSHDEAFTDAHGSGKEKHDVPWYQFQVVNIQDFQDKKEYRGN